MAKTTKTAPKQTAAQKKLFDAEMAKVVQSFENSAAGLKVAIKLTRKDDMVCLIPNTAGSIGVDLNGVTKVDFTDLPTSFTPAQARQACTVTCRLLDGTTVHPVAVNAIEYYKQELTKTLDILAKISA